MFQDPQVDMGALFISRYPLLWLSIEPLKHFPHSHQDLVPITLRISYED